jgi:hypothetical protein
LDEFVVCAARPTLPQTPIHQLISWSRPLRTGPSDGDPRDRAEDVGRCRGCWADAEDPGHAAKQWFSRHPVEKTKLEQIWQTSEVTLPWLEQPIRLRRDSLGPSGKNHRYVWLAAHIERETAQGILTGARR